MCSQSHVLGSRTKFQLEILAENVISGIVYFGEMPEPTHYGAKSLSGRTLAKTYMTLSLLTGIQIVGPWEI